MNYTSSSVARILGLSKRRIDYWDRSHFVKPSVSGASGRGSVRLYAFCDLIQMKVAKTLLDKGVSLQKIRKAVHYLKRHIPEVERPLSALRFLTDGESIFVLTTDNKEIIDTLGSGQIVLSIALGEMVEDLRGEVISFQRERYFEVTVRGEKYKVTLHPDSEGGRYRVGCPLVQDCAVQADSLEEALGMIRDEIEGSLKALRKGAARRYSGKTK